ncbi:MAG: DinB family protein [Phycisphaeraceae bacterium]|nr:DinB family protein [Phycisphaeraceae bacterium]
MPGIAEAIVPAGRIAMSYGQNMLKDVKGSDFARLAPGAAGRVKSNHPAWVFGHLALYAPRMLGMVGVNEPAWFDVAKFEPLFKNGAECRDDAEGTIYPKMDEIVGAWSKGYDRVLSVLAGVSDEVYMRPNPAEGRLKEMCPTVGAMCCFMIAGHTMSHYGQVSAWRRMMGMGSAM